MVFFCDLCPHLDERKWHGDIITRRSNFASDFLKKKSFKHPVSVVSFLLSLCIISVIFVFLFLLLVEIRGRDLYDFPNLDRV